jgi:hypothetical protein
MARLQAEAEATIACTPPAETIGHQASMLRRMSSRPPSGSLRWARTAPQQPVPVAKTVWMLALSSTRAAARSMLGIIDGCTQPRSIKTWLW